MVLRYTTTCQPSLSRSAAPISAVTSSRYRVNSAPPAADGVPTQISETSVARTASCASEVTTRLPAATTAAVRSPISASTIGDVPCRRADILSGFTSTPTTRWPREARHAALTQPT